MRTIADFTSLCLGPSLDGPVVRCPGCGRNGVLQQNSVAGWLCLHAEATTVEGDGMRVEPVDFCAISPVSSPRPRSARAPRRRGRPEAQKSAV